MSTPDSKVPYLAAPVLSRSAGFTPCPGLSLEAITELEASYPGVLTPEMRSLLESTCGLEASDFGTIDFTSLWHPVESISVLRPSLTLAIDDGGRRWIAETSRQRGLPGPVWCIFSDPAVAVYASDDLGGFLDIIQAAARQAQLSAWIQDLHEQAQVVWTCRNSLARESYHICLKDPGLRGWLAELPFGARIYDLRKPSAMRGWPYGLAGPDGELYRCGRLPVFAVSRSPRTSCWMQHMAQIATAGEILSPAVARPVYAA